MNSRGHYSFNYTRPGDHLRSKLLGNPDWENIEVGDRFFYAHSERRYQIPYEVMKIKERKLHLRKVTKGGNLSRSKHKSANIHPYNWVTERLYILPENGHELVYQYREESKKIVKTGERRDHQRSKVYTAERKAASNAEVRNLKYSSLEEAEERINEMISQTPWIKNRTNSRVTITVNNYKKNKCTGGNSGIEVAGNSIEFGKKKWVVIHELAHVLAPISASHGGKFVAIYLELLRIELPKMAKYLEKQIEIRNLDCDEEYIMELIQDKAA